MERHNDTTEATRYLGKHDEKEKGFARTFFASALFSALVATAALWGSVAFLG